MKNDDNSLWPLGVAGMLISFYILGLKWSLISAAIGVGGVFFLSLIVSMIEKIRSAFEDKSRGLL